MLKAPVLGATGGPWSYQADAAPLLLGGVTRFWTEHGERNWPPSLAASTRQCVEAIDYFGRCQAKVSK
eukprot:6280486-Lingulodinium_polyedra.AAC.1